MIKTEHDFNLEKQMLIHRGKSKVNEQLRAMERSHQVEQRIERSNSITAARTKRMEARDQLLQELVNDANGRVQSEADKPSYPPLLESLVVQGLLTLENEIEVEVVCRKEDVSIVKAQIKGAAKQFAKMKNGASINVSLSSKFLKSDLVPREPSGPGVVVTARQGTVVCDNTLGTRLASVVYDKTPELRADLFPKE
jgi:V-type H+-transporting ATPase subunit E